MDGERAVFKVQHFVLLERHWHSAITDLVFDQETPYAVLAWDTSNYFGSPRLKIRLERRYLVPVNSPEFDYIYRLTIEDAPQAH